MPSDGSDYSGALPRKESCTNTPEKEERATYQDVLDAPPNMVAEVVGGALYTHSRPAMPHARASSRLGVRLGDPFDSDCSSRSGPGARKNGRRGSRPRIEDS